LGRIVRVKIRPATSEDAAEIAELLWALGYPSGPLEVEPHGPKRPLPPFLDGVAASHSGKVERTQLGEGEDQSVRSSAMTGERQRRCEPFRAEIRDALLSFELADPALPGRRLEFVEHRLHRRAGEPS
jgi:hypothetical protein